MPRLGIVCFDDVTDIDVLLHWDVLNRPRTMFPIAEEDWEVLLLGTKDTHTTRAGLAIPMHARISEARNLDAVVHASGRATRKLMRDDGYLRQLARQTKWLGTMRWVHTSALSSLCE